MVFFNKANFFPEELVRDSQVLKTEEQESLLKFQVLFSSVQYP